VKIAFGRNLFGLAAILFGAIALGWHDFNDWQQAKVVTYEPLRETLLYAIAIAQIAGGVAIQWRRTTHIGAAVLFFVSLFFALMWVPRVAAAPLVYDNWGNLFEQSSMVAGALIAYTCAPFSLPAWRPNALRIGHVLFGICVVSFTFEQLFYLKATADFVPKWIPPNQMFWAVTTTIAFALAAIAILSGHFELLASRLLTTMIVLFGILIWVPAALADPHSHFAWGGNAENFGIAGAAWILTDYLRRASPQFAYDTG
jgi:hypothetical protein